MRVSRLESYHLHPFPRNQRWHFQSWIQTTDLRNVVHYAVDWKKASPHCPGKCFPRADFPPLSTSNQEVPAVRASPYKTGSANFQLRSELRFVPFAEEFEHVLDFLDAGNAKSFLWRLFFGVIACYNVWAQRGVQSSP